MAPWPPIWIRPCNQLYSLKLYSWLQANQKADVHSVKSRSSSDRSSSAASNGKMQQLAKLAALEATRKFVAKETQLERERFESEQKAKELQLEKEMAIAHAELAVYERYLPAEQPAWSTADADIIIEQSVVSNSDQMSHPTTAGVLSSYGPPTAVALVPNQNVRPPGMSVVRDSQQSVASDRNLLPAQASAYSAPNITIGSHDELPVVLPHVSHSNEEVMTHNNSDTVVASFGEALKRTQLPKLELAVFAGDPIEFQ